MIVDNMQKVFQAREGFKDNVAVEIFHGENMIHKYQKDSSDMVRRYERAQRGSDSFKQFNLICLFWDK